MKKDIFLVDADNTLLDFHGSSFLAIREALESFSVSWKEEFAAIFTRLNDGLWEALERKEIKREKLVRIRFPMYLKELGLSHIDGEEFNKKYLHLLSTRPLYIDGAEEFLKKLKDIGRVFIVTNGTEWIQKSRFEILGIKNYIDGVFVSDTIGADKPDPKYTEYVLEHIDNFEKADSLTILSFLIKK
jgi:2-haloacid dehalogenase